jgi:hypothetical protein
MLHVLFQPLELFRSKRSHASGLQVHDIHESNEMRALQVKAVPAWSVEITSGLFFSGILPSFLNRSSSVHGAKQGARRFIPAKFIVYPRE